MCYQISVFALYRDRAGQAASVWGYSRAEGKPQQCSPRYFQASLSSALTVSLMFCSTISWAPDVHNTTGKRHLCFLGRNRCPPASGLHPRVPHVPAERGRAGTPGHLRWAKTGVMCVLGEGWRGAQIIQRYFECGTIRFLPEIFYECEH